MCDYIYLDGSKCQEASLEGSKYCALHISFEEGEKLVGREKLEELKLSAVARKLQARDLNFEGAYLYTFPVTWEVLEELGIKEIEDDIILNNANVLEVIIRGKEDKLLKFKDLIIYNANIGEMYITSSQFHGVYSIPPTVYGVISEKIKDLINGSDMFIVDPNLFKIKEIQPITDSTCYVGKLYIIFCEGSTLWMSGLNSSQIILSESNVTDIWFNSSIITEFVLGKNLSVSNDINLKFSAIKTGKLIPPIKIGGRLYLNDTNIHSNRFAVEMFNLAKRLFKESSRPEDLDNLEYHFYREMVARRKWKAELAKEEWQTTNKKSFKKLLRFLLAKSGSILEWAFLDAPIKYGTSWKRLLSLWFSLVLIIFPILYRLTGTVPGIKSYWQAMYFSIVTATTLGYGDFHPEGLGTFLASLEAIFGTFMWALLITTLGRKYLDAS